MSTVSLAERVFTPDDQEAFAAASGDRNPIHMDPVAARRTLAGAPVVHGVHALLWGLDNLFRHLSRDDMPTSISVTFAKMIYVGDRVRIDLLEQDARKVRFQLVVRTLSAVRVTLLFGGSPANLDSRILYRGEAEPPRQEPPQLEPLVLAFDEMIDRAGTVPFFSPPASICTLFPAAAAALGPERAAGLCCASYLVGMVCPGLHSLFGGLELATAPGAEHALHFKVKDVDARFRRARIGLSGAGWTGSLIVNVRPEPTPQADMASLAAKLVPGEFSGRTSLVIGGSRGLGELVCKIIAAGGGDVIATYATGISDARRVEQQIARFGGRCSMLRYDARDDADDQLKDLSGVPDHLYYFATPFIATQRYKDFEADRLADFVEVYVNGFHRLIEALRGKTGAALSIFYPSSVFVETRPKGMTEYAMAKAAGELLCADLQAFGRCGPILVNRLPRLATDQTASLRDTGASDPVEVMLPLVRDVHAARPVAGLSREQVSISER